MSESQWKDDDASRARAARELAAIARAQSDRPKCWLCGQRTNKVDTYGLCSKTNTTHTREREAQRAAA